MSEDALDKYDQIAKAILSELNRTAIIIRKDYVDDLEAEVIALKQKIESMEAERLSLRPDGVAKNVSSTPETIECGSYLNDGKITPIIWTKTDRTQPPEVWVAQVKNANLSISYNPNQSHVIYSAFVNWTVEMDRRLVSSCMSKSYLTMEHAMWAAVIDYIDKSIWSK